LNAFAAKLEETTMRTLAIAILACLATHAVAATADLEANKLLIRGYIEEVFNKHQPAASDRFVAANFIEHNPRLPHDGLAGITQFVTKVFAAFSDYHGEIQNMVAEGDRVVARIQWTGTNDGPYEGRPATGNKLVFSTADFFRIENGKNRRALGRGGDARARGRAGSRAATECGKPERTRYSSAPAIEERSGFRVFPCRENGDQNRRRVSGYEVFWLPEQGGHLHQHC
jgi:predicted ester cyclase